MRSTVGPFQTYEHMGCELSDNSVSIAVGDVFDLGNGYRLFVGEEKTHCEGHGYGNGENDEKLINDRNLAVCEPERFAM